MNKLFVVAMLVCVIACNKKNGATAGKRADGSIVGKWKLTESLADPGDGSGVWTAADPVNPVYLEFKEDNSLIFTPSGIYNSDHYRILSDSTILFLRDTDQLQLRYKLLENKLTLTPPCYEPCGQKYIAVE